MDQIAIPSLAPGHSVISKNTARSGVVLDMPRQTPWLTWWLLVAWEDGTVSDILADLVINLGP